MLIFSDVIDSIHSDSSYHLYILIIFIPVPVITPRNVRSQVAPVII